MAGSFGTTGTGDVTGLTKQVYTKDGIINLIPECAIISKDVAFSSSNERIGLTFNQPVVVSPEHGRTFAAPDSNNFSINQASSMKLQNAQVPAYQIVMQSSLDYETAFRAAGEGPAAFEKATSLQMRTVFESATKTLEIEFLYGKDYLGLVASYSNVSSTQTTLTITTSDFAAGIWSGMENCLLDFWQGSSTKVNAAALTVVAVSVQNKTVTVSGTSSDITAVQSAVTSYPNAAGLTWYGAGVTTRGDQEMYGLKGIYTNTGTLFNVNAAQYNLWQANTYGTGSAALTFAKIQSAVATAVARGLTEDVTVFLNPFSWQDLLTDQAALRLYDSSYSDVKVSNGSKELVFYSQNGMIKLVPHLFVKAGDAFMQPMKKLKRIGSTDWTFNIPGTMNGEVFIQQSGNAGFTYRLYTGQSIFVDTPARCTYINGIVNS